MLIRLLVFVLLVLNSKAPDFALEGSDGKKHALKEFHGRYLVLYFYPRDDTPGCTIEAKGFSSKIADIKKLGAEVVGVSSDDIESHNKFCSKHGLRLLLLSDTSSATIKKYDSYGSRGIFGMGTLRKTFLIGKDGKIKEIFEKVNPMGHADQIIMAIKKHEGK